MLNILNILTECPRIRVLRHGQPIIHYIITHPGMVWYGIVWYGRCQWRIPGGRSVRDQLRIGTMLLGTGTFSEQTTFICLLGCSHHIFCMGTTYFAIFFDFKTNFTPYKMYGGSNLINECSLITGPFSFSPFKTWRKNCIRDVLLLFDRTPTPLVWARIGSRYL